RQVHRFLSVASQPMAERYPRWLTFFHNAAKRRLYTPEFAFEIERQMDSQPVEWKEGWLDGLVRMLPRLDPIDAAMSVDIASYLPYDLLVKVDITSMANSLEARSPFLDHEVMEFTAKLPIGVKVRGRELKYMLKRAFADLLPPENVNRRKMGFGVPVGRWFRGPLREFLNETLLSERAMRREYFEPERVQRLLGEHIENRAEHSFLLWNLLMLELWHREFMDAR